LQDMGLHSSANALQLESGIAARSAFVDALHCCIDRGDWPSAEAICRQHAPSFADCGAAILLLQRLSYIDKLLSCIDLPPSEAASSRAAAMLLLQQFTANHAALPATSAPPCRPANLASLLLLPPAQIPAACGFASCAALRTNAVKEMSALLLPSGTQSGGCLHRGGFAVTCHTSHVTRHTSHFTRHTSHVTRHTSHVTRHTSHVTRHT
jgi:hypothetical protein